MSSDVTEPKWSLRLPADCSIAAIRSVYDLIREAFGRQDRLEIDCSSVDKADVTSIQLLLSAAKTGDAGKLSASLPHFAIPRWAHAWCRWARCSAVSAA